MAYFLVYIILVLCVAASVMLHGIQVSRVFGPVLAAFWFVGMLYSLLSFIVTYCHALQPIGTCTCSLQSQTAGGLY